MFKKSVSATFVQSKSLFTSWNWSRRAIVVLTFITLWVLQAKTRFVPFGHLGSIEAEQVIERKHLHAVIMPTHTDRNVVLQT